MKKLLKFLGIFLMFIKSNSVLAQATSIEKQAHTATEVLEYVKDLPSDAVIFLDIDDTIITPKSKAFRAGAPHTIIDAIKKEKDSYPNYKEIISNWRLERKVMLLDSNWPKVLENLKAKYRVYALTKMEVGQCGNIPSMQKWRYEELKGLGIEFSLNPSLPDQDANFYKGIFMTGDFSKADILEKYSPYFKTNTIVMVDDRADYIKEIKELCARKSINYVGILYLGMKNFNDKPDAKVVEFQKDYLIKNMKWIEDDEAAAMMKEGLPK